MSNPTLNVSTPFKTLISAFTLIGNYSTGGKLALNESEMKTLFDYLFEPGFAADGVTDGGVERVQIAVAYFQSIYTWAKSIEDRLQDAGGDEMEVDLKTQRLMVNGEDNIKSVVRELESVIMQIEEAYRGIISTQADEITSLKEDLARDRREMNRLYDELNEKDRILAEITLEETVQPQPGFGFIADEMSDFSIHDPSKPTPLSPEIKKLADLLGIKLRIAN